MSPTIQFAIVLCTLLIFTAPARSQSAELQDSELQAMAVTDSLEENNKVLTRAFYALSSFPELLKIT